MSTRDEKKLEDIRTKLKELLVDELMLDDISPRDIKDDEILFGEGLGLDSLDGVEIVVLLQRNFGVEIRDVNQARTIFESIKTISDFVYDNSNN